MAAREMALVMAGTSSTDELLPVEGVQMARGRMTASGERSTCEGAPLHRLKRGGGAGSGYVGIYI
jgi:hypothetical protein